MFLTLETLYNILTEVLPQTLTPLKPFQTVRLANGSLYETEESLETPKREQQVRRKGLK